MGYVGIAVRVARLRGSQGGGLNIYTNIILLSYPSWHRSDIVLGRQSLKAHIGGVNGATPPCHRGCFVEG